MTNEKEKTVETIDTLESGKQSEALSLELDEELSEADMEEVAGGCSYTTVTETQRL